VGNLVNQHVRFIESGEFLTYPKPALGSSESRLIERKQMSTKTSFKRIALVAVAALGFGVLSVAPSTAAVQSDALTLGATTSTGVIGTAVTNTVSVSFIDTDASAETATATVALLSSPATSTVLPTVTISSAQTTANALTGATSASGLVLSVASTAAGRTTGDGTISLTAAVAGTYVIRVTPAGGLTTTAQTWTVTIAAKAVLTTYGTTVRMIPAYSNGSVDTMGNTFVNPYGTGASATISLTHATLTDTVSCYSDPTYAGSQCAILEVAQSNATATTANTLLGADAADITVSITGTGGGTVALAGGFGGNNPNGYFDYANSPKGVAVYEGAVTNTYARASLLKRVSVFTTGQTGTSTVTIKAGDTVLGTKTVIFYGNAATISTAAVVNSVIATGNSNAANVGAVTAYVYDALGNPIPGFTLYANSSDTTVIANASAVTSSAGMASFTLNGALAGTATLSITNVAPLATTTPLAGVNSVSVRVGSTTPASVSWALDAASYVPGGLATLTVTLKDAAGLPVVNGTYANIFAATATSTLALAGGSLPGTSVVAGTSTGSATYTFNMPLATGAVEIKGTTGTGVALANQGVAVSLPATVEGGAAADAANAAADAAAEATDAANAATDAANAAAEAADAATAAAQDAADAVAALSTEVTELISALRKQITSLTNLVIKIQKKVKA
jgi:trimeric autotransporter adhesin